MSIKHRLKLIPARIRWYFTMLMFAKKHAKEVDNYKFLIDLKAKADKYMLAVQKDKNKKKELDRVNIQLELLDKIINYVQR